MEENILDKQQSPRHAHRLNFHHWNGFPFLEINASSRKLWQPKWAPLSHPYWRQGRKIWHICGCVLFTHSVLRDFIWNQEFSSHCFRHKIHEFFGTKSFYQTGNYLTVPVAMLLLAALRASFCAHHLVQVFTHRLNPRGLHKYLNIA